MKRMMGWMAVVIPGMLAGPAQAQVPTVRTSPDVVIKTVSDHAGSSRLYDKKGETCKEVVGPNTKYEPDNLSNYNVVRPELDAVYSFVKDPAVYDKAEFDGLLKGVQVTVVVPPKHGKLMPVQVSDDKVYKGYFYMAEPGYFGVDRVVFNIKFGNGKTILLNNVVSVVGMPSMGEQINACPDTPANYQWMREHLPEIKKAWEDMTGGAADDYLSIRITRT